MCEVPSGQSFHTGQIYAVRYPITPLFASKLVNFCTYFRHLCIIEKRRPLLSFWLATVVDIGLLTVSDAKVPCCAITYRIDVNSLGVNNTYAERRN